MVCQIQEKKALVLRVKPNNGGSPVRTGSKNSGGKVDDKEARQERVSNYTVKKENIAMSTEIFNVTQQTPNQLLTIRKKYV